MEVAYLKNGVIQEQYKHDVARRSCTIVIPQWKTCYYLISNSSSIGHVDYLARLIALGDQERSSSLREAIVPKSIFTQLSGLEHQDKVSKRDPVVEASEMQQPNYENEMVEELYKYHVASKQKDCFTPIYES